MGLETENAATTLLTAAIIEPLTELVGPIAEACLLATIVVGGLDILQKAIAGERRGS